MRIAYKSLTGGTLVLGLCMLAACNGGSSSGDSSAPASQVPGGTTQQTHGYNSTVLVIGPNTPASGSSGGSTPVVDSNLVKPWDLAAGDGSIWVADAHTNVATAYDASGTAQGTPIRIPGSRGASHVTGVVANPGTTGFLINTNGVSSAASYIFSTSSGTIAAWSSGIGTGAGAGAGNSPVTVYTDPAGTAQYTGLAVLSAGSNQFLYATDFVNGRIDTFDSNFNKISTSGNFRDPNLPAGYMPFNIETLANRLAVVYVKPQTVTGTTTGVAGGGIVDIYDASGNLDHRLITDGQLNAPRGIALAPDNFGELGGKLLVANSGDGHINAFDRYTGAFVATLNDANGAAVTIPGISALAFRNGDRIGASTSMGSNGGTGSSSGSGVGSISDNTLFFTAGTANSLQSAFGRIQPAPVTSTGGNTGAGSSTGGTTSVTGTTGSGAGTGNATGTGGGSSGTGGAGTGSTVTGSTGTGSAGTGTSGTGSTGTGSGSTSGTGSSGSTTGLSTL